MYSDFQVELLKTVHAHIEERQARFICCSIATVVNMPNRLEYFDRFNQGERIKEEIAFAIDHYVSFELWLFTELGIYPEDISEDARAAWGSKAYAGWQRAMPRDEYENLCRVCRMTWIERAIETGSML